MESHETLVLSFVPSSGDPTDASWQEECRELLQALRVDPALEAMPVAQPGSREGTRALDFKNFHELALAIAGSASAGAVASHVWELLTSWLKRRRGCSCVIRTQDGSEFTFSDLTKEEALRLLSQQLRRPTRQRSQ